MRYRWLLPILILFAVTLAEKTQLPDMKIKSLDKKPAKTSDLYKDGPILINFWSLSCEPCKKEMVHLNNFNQKYAKSGFQVKSINIDSPRSLAKVKSYVKSKKYSFDIFLDPKAEFFRKTGGKVMPYVLVVNSSGEIVSRHMGYNTGDEKHLEEDIQALIKNEAKNKTAKTEEAPIEK